MSPAPRLPAVTSSSAAAAASTAVFRAACWSPCCSRAGDLVGVIAGALPAMPAPPWHGRPLDVRWPLLWRAESMLGDLQEELRRAVAAGVPAPSAAASALPCCLLPLLRGCSWGCRILLCSRHQINQISANHVEVFFCSAMM